MRRERAGGCCGVALRTVPEKLWHGAGAQPGGLEAGLLRSGKELPGRERAARPPAVAGVDHVLENEDGADLQLVVCD